jgi:hypothetical protein
MVASPLSIAFVRKAAVSDPWRRGNVRTRLSICKKKHSYPSEEEALAVAWRAEIPLRTYRCDRCRLFHLTSRTKGKPMLRRAESPSS